MKNTGCKSKKTETDNRSVERRQRLIFGVSLLLLFTMIVPSLQILAQQPRVIQITATSDNKFKVAGQKVPVITVKPKEVIKFQITSQWGDEKDPKWPGCPHSFSVKGFEDQGWNKCLKEGKNEFVLVAPGDPGEYKIECLAKCGKGHDDMSMKMVVAK
jgi:heme/copper-type cytochrome/quinol oxidase subunit 2